MTKTGHLQPVLPQGKVASNELGECSVLTYSLILYAFELQLLLHPYLQVAMIFFETAKEA